MPISAKEGAGIDDLLDMVLLTADMESGNIKANPKSSAIGTIIESRVDKGEGPVATVLVQNGTLKIGDQLCFSGQSYGKVRALRNYLGENIEQAEPSVPAKIIGLKSAPKVGDILEVGAGEKIKNKKIKYAPQELTNKKSNESENENIKTKRINLIIKSDVLGSGGAIEESLAKIEIPEIKINIIKKGLGNITESDITQAEASQAQVIGFNVKSPSAVEELARSKNVIVKIYVVIYELINDIKSRIQELVEPEVKRVDLGRLKVLAIFRTEANSQIIGGKAIDKAIEDSSFIDVCRDKEVIASGKLTKLQSGKQDVKSVEADQECGIQYEGKPLIKEGDILQVWKEERITKII